MLQTSMSLLDLVGDAINRCGHVLVYHSQFQLLKDSLEMFYHCTQSNSFQITPFSRNDEIRLLLNEICNVCAMFSGSFVENRTMNESTMSNGEDSELVTILALHRRLCDAISCTVESEVVQTRLTRCLQFRYWYPFARSYQDGRTNVEGQACHVLSEFRFGGRAPDKWYSNQPLSDWSQVNLVESDSSLGIKELGVSEAELMSIPDSVGSLTSLTTLDVSSNNLSILPESIGNLKSLTELWVHGNRLTALPESIGNLKSLLQFGLSGNVLLELPPSIGNLQFLLELYVNNNQLQFLPDTIGNMKFLTYLKASNNRLASIPDCIDKMISLTQLDVALNQLEVIPDSISRAPRLRWLSVGCNPVTSTDAGKNEVMARFAKPGLRLNV